MNSFDFLSSIYPSDSWRLPPLDPAKIEFIEKDNSLRSVLLDLTQSHALALDTESNGFYAYAERICLIQISTTQKNYIIDPLVVKNCYELNNVLSDAAIEKIVHHGVNDVSGLYHDFNITIKNLFDTSVACQLLGIKKRGLASLVATFFGVVVSKKEQRHDWGKRPLNEKQLLYAALDTYYLIPLARILKQELARKGLLKKALEMSEAVTAHIVPKRGFSSKGYVHIKGYRDLDNRGRLIAKCLYNLRDELARQKNRAPFRVLSNEAIINLSQEKPESVEDLLKVKGIPVAFKEGKLLHRLLEIIAASNKYGNKYGEED